ncbi:MAG: glycine cleavage system protein GcvH [Clostridia bacterium]
MEVKDGMRYTREHEWLDGEGRVGITDYAQDQLGDVVFVELPKVGDRLDKGETFGVVESVKSVSDLFAPASGTVTAVNQALADRPELVNEDPFGEGWLVQVEVDGEPGDLLSAEEYRGFTEA